MIQDLPSTDSWLPLVFGDQDYVGQMLLQEAVRNHGRVDLMTKKNGEKLAATWSVSRVRFANKILDRWGISNIFR